MQRRATLHGAGGQEIMIRMLKLGACVVLGALLSTCGARGSVFVEEEAEQTACEELFLPHHTSLPQHTTREQDEQAAALFVRMKDEKGYEVQRTLLMEALALESISSAVHDMLQKELDLLVPPPPPAAKPKSAFQAVSLPKQLPKSKSRYSVNMGEMMRTINDAGVTEDPFKQ